MLTVTKEVVCPSRGFAQGVISWLRFPAKHKQGMLGGVEPKSAFCLDSIDILRAFGAPCAMKLSTSSVDLTCGGSDRAVQFSYVCKVGRRLHEWAMRTRFK